MSEEKKRPQDISSADKLIRVQEVLELLLSGCTKNQIVRYCSEKFNVGERATENYISDAKVIMVENFQKTVDLEAFKAEVYTRLEDLYQRSLEIEDFKACQGILKDIREMVGLNAPKQLDIKSDGKQITAPPSIIHVSVVPPIEEDDE